MSELPTPLVPAECDMGGNDWFPLYFDRLKKSRWWRRSSHMARSTNIVLWGEAYKQVPAGSMPNDDDELADAAGFGMDTDAFIAAKAEIMAPWTLCSDGRWYHPTLCEVVLTTWERLSEKRRLERERKARQRAQVRGQDPSVPQDSGGGHAGQGGVSHGTEGGVPAENGTQETIGQERTDSGAEGAPDLPLEAFDRWNETARRWNLPIAELLTEYRRKAIRARLKNGGLDRWNVALAAVEQSAFLVGQKKGADGEPFRADLDFLSQASKFQRVVEGFYGKGAKPLRAVQPELSEEDVWRSRLDGFRRANYWKDAEWGSRPRSIGCRAPVSLLREFEFAPPAQPW